MRQMGLWMGIFWIGIAIFLLLSQWLGKASYPLPKLNINLGWVVLVLGIWRLWWWWTTVEKPYRRRLAFQQEQRQMELELEQKLLQSLSVEPNKTDAPPPSTESNKMQPPATSDQEQQSSQK